MQLYLEKFLPGLLAVKILVSPYVEKFLIWILVFAILFSTYVAYKHSRYFKAKYRSYSNTLMLFAFGIWLFVLGIEDGLETVGLQILQVNYSVAAGFILERQLHLFIISIGFLIVVGYLHILSKLFQPADTGEE